MQFCCRRGFKLLSEYKGNCLLTFDHELGGVIGSCGRVAGNARVCAAVLGRNLLEDEHAVELGGALLHLERDFYITQGMGSENERAAPAAFSFVPNP